MTLKHGKWTAADLNESGFPFGAISCKCVLHLCPRVAPIRRSGLARNNLWVAQLCVQRPYSALGLGPPI